MSERVVDPIDNLTDELMIHRWEFHLVPRLWSVCDVEPLDWAEVRLAVENKCEVPEASGVYTLLIGPKVASHPHCSYLVYVGKSNNLRRRFSEYLAEMRNRRRPKVYRFLNKYEEHVCYCFATLAEALVVDAETALINAFMPPCNSDFTGDVGTARRAF